ncbi:MAG: polysaccharide deacetylase family protein [bacterium]|nr:polysaccharide deacetylase family protein [bacterium]
MRKVLILLYHRVFPGNHIDPETFDSQMKILKERFQPLSLEETIAFTRGELKLKKDGCHITFDDGWADNFVYAYPILKKNGLKGTLFAATNFISNQETCRPNLEDYWQGKTTYQDLFQGKDNDRAAADIAQKKQSDQFLTWAEINSMRPTIEVETHGHYHAYHFKSEKIIGQIDEKPVGRQNWLLLSETDLKPNQPLYESGSALACPRYNYLRNELEKNDAYKKRVLEELRISRDAIEKNTGRISNYLAWPYGEYNESAIKLTQEAGLKACLTINAGWTQRGNNLYELKRFSPPRRHSLFLSAISGKAGMIFYKSIINTASLFKRNEIV